MIRKKQILIKGKKNERNKGRDKNEKFKWKQRKRKKKQNNKNAKDTNRRKVKSNRMIRMKKILIEGKKKTKEEMER